MNVLLFFAIIIALGMLGGVSLSFFTNRRKEIGAGILLLCSLIFLAVALVLTLKDIPSG